MLRWATKAWGIAGRDGVASFLSRVSSGANTWTVTDMVVDSERACAMVDFTVVPDSAVMLPIIECLKVVNGQTERFDLYFEPRPLTQE